VLGGSIRGSGRDDANVLSFVGNISSLDEYIEKVCSILNQKGVYGKGGMFSCNTEIIAGAALLGAKAAGADIDYYSMKNIFPKMENSLSSFQLNHLGVNHEYVVTDWLGISEDGKEELIGKINNANGIILASPVYFGDRSSIANKLLQFALQEELLSGKIVGSLSVGAKRNGGQETTNIYALYEALNMGAFIVGNGPPTGQYGGTAVGGDVGSVSSDRWGLETCMGTGRRVAQVAELLKGIPENYRSCSARIIVLNCMDTPGKMLSRRVDEYIKANCFEKGNIQIRKIDLIDYDIYRCLSCDICPVPQRKLVGGKKPKENRVCVIDGAADEFDVICDELRMADGIILAGLNLKNMKSVIYRYQVFTERTRFLRRNDFEMSNIPVVGCLLNEVGARNNPIFDLKVITSYIRHNGIILSPIVEHFSNGKIIVDGTAGFLGAINTIQKITASRRLSKGIVVSYKAGESGGYKAVETDATFAMRK